MDSANMLWSQNLNTSNGHLSNLAKEVNDIKMRQRMVLKNLGAIYAPNKILSVALEK